MLQFLARFFKRRPEINLQGPQIPPDVHVHDYDIYYPDSDRPFFYVFKCSCGDVCHDISTVVQRQGAVG